MTHPALLVSRSPSIRDETFSETATIDEQPDVRLGLEGDAAVSHSAGKSSKERDGKPVSACKVCPRSY